ncbi:hypothetical protein Pelo_18479 [Pelomyxa schiedti]|nr:hypothetical protein Pelo_18479 [Pelomyxa schiedti]
MAEVFIDELVGLVRIGCLSDTLNWLRDNLLLSGLMPSPPETFMKRLLSSLPPPKKHHHIRFPIKASDIHPDIGYWKLNKHAFALKTIVSWYSSALPVADLQKAHSQVDDPWLLTFLKPELELLPSLFSWVAELCPFEAIQHKLEEFFTRGGGRVLDVHPDQEFKQKSLQSLRQCEAHLAQLGLPTSTILYRVPSSLTKSSIIKSPNDRRCSASQWRYIGLNLKKDLW